MRTVLFHPPDKHTHTHDAMVGVPGASRLMMLMSPSTVPAARRWETLGFGLNWTERTGAVCRSMCASWACSPAPVGWREGRGREDGVRRGARAIGGFWGEAWDTTGAVVAAPLSSSPSRRAPASHTETTPSDMPPTMRPCDAAAAPPEPRLVTWPQAKDEKRVRVLTLRVCEEGERG
jgi:hypothetical protein